MVAIAGTYTGTGSKASGAQSLTDVTIPSGVTIALITLHYYDYPSVGGISSITLDGIGMTSIGSFTSTTYNSVAAYWVTGMSSGASKTFAYTNDAAHFAGVGVRIGFLSGTPTASPIRGTAAGSGATNGNVDFSGISFSSGDWTIIATCSDNSGVLLDGGANTQLVAESASDGPYSGQAYRTDAGAIGTPSSTNSYLGAIAFTVKNDGGGGAAAGFGPLLAPMRNRRVLP